MWKFPHIPAHTCIPCMSFPTFAEDCLANPIPWKILAPMRCQEGGGGDSAPLGKLTEQQIEKGQAMALTTVHMDVPWLRGWRFGMIRYRCIFVTRLWISLKALVCFERHPEYPEITERRGSYRSLSSSKGVTVCSEKNTLPSWVKRDAWPGTSKLWRNGIKDRSKWKKSYLASTPNPITVTFFHDYQSFLHHMFAFLVGNPCKPSFPTCGR